MPVLRVQAAGRLMSDFSFSVRCPFCGGRYAPDDGSCCEPPDEEEDEDVGRGVGPDDGPEGSRSVAPSSPRALRRTLSTPSGRRGSDCIHISAIIGAQRPLRQHKPPEPPPSNSLKLVFAVRSPIPCRAYQLMLLIRPAGTEECMYYPGVEAPETTTKSGTALFPCSMSTSPRRIARMCPCAANAAITAGRNLKAASRCPSTP